MLELFQGEVPLGLLVGERCRVERPDDFPEAGGTLLRRDAVATLV
ncbi:hypothetical protein ACFWWM_07905 [Streptomyces sp. NPDC058682]